MRIDLVKSSLKALVRANEEMLVDGMVIAEKVPQWSIAQLSTSIFTAPRRFPFIGIHVDRAESSIDTSRIRNMSAASSVASLPGSGAYDVTIRVIGKGQSVSGEIPGGETDKYETVDAMFDLLVARTVLMLRDNAEFASEPAGYTLALETENGRSDTQRIDVAYYSDFIPWGGEGSAVASHICDIRFRVTACGEPRADA